MKKEAMQTRTKVLSLTAIVLAAVAFGMILAGSLDFTRTASAELAAEPASRAAAPAPRPGPVGLPSFADIADRAMPAVVSIRSTDIIKPGQRRSGMDRFFGDTPFNPFFGPDRRRGSGEDEEEQEQSGGTGFIVEADGYVLTNNHVIDGAEKVEVSVGETDVYKAKVVGRDPATDLALLKIDGTKPFPTLPLGDSDRIRVGEWVMAIGDPLQFDKTVTVGVISGKGRAPGLSNVTRSFENLIQTDAAINQGNSGGPLVNLAGEVIGINTMIVRSSSSGTVAEGLGFAIPVNTARAVAEQIIQKGYFARPKIGISWQFVTPALAARYGLPVAWGAYVTDVQANSPAQRAGLKEGDIITQFDDITLDDTQPFINTLFTYNPGDTVTLTVMRENTEMHVDLTLE